MSLADELRLAGKQIHEATATDRPAALNAGFERALIWPLKASSGKLMDGEGNVTEAFACVIHSSKDCHQGDRSISADNAAAAIDLVEELDPATLRAAYMRLFEVRQLRKTPAPVGVGREVATVTLTAIFAHQTAMTLEAIAKELQTLNEGRPHSDWLDMLVVSNIGVVTNACQLPGGESIGGIIPPSKEALSAAVPAFYVLQVLQPTLNGSFNKLVALIVGYMGFFAPGIPFANFNDILVGVTPSIIPLKGYQYNLAGALQSVPRHLYADRYMPHLPMLVEDSKTKQLLASLQFIPWQDGGVILLRGKLPLEGLMIFLGPNALKKGGVMRVGPETQASYVMPITMADFLAMTTRLRNQSNMIVRQARPSFTVEKMADEGTSTPYIARIFLGLVNLRDASLKDAGERKLFDKSLEETHIALSAARMAAKEITTMWTDHVAKVASGEVATINCGNIHIDVDFNRPFRKEVHGFLYDAARALKAGMQGMGEQFGKKMGFMFQKQTPYLAGLTKLQTTDPVLAAYLQQTRAVWSERLIEARNALDHDGWSLSKATYAIRDARVVAHPPLIKGQPVAEFVDFVLDRLCCFVEEFTAYCLLERMPTGMAIAEIPFAERPSDAPERFVPTLRYGGLTPWVITYHAARFEQV